MGLRVTYEELETVGFDIGGGEMLNYNGQPFTGTIVEYNEQGILISEEEFTDGHMGGAQRDFYQNGNIRQEYFIAYNTYYGYIRTWDEQGNLTLEHYWGEKP